MKVKSKRLRVFAGPNGSGKSTIIHSIRSLTVNNRTIDFGFYINADDIAKDLSLNKFSIRQGSIILDLDIIQSFGIATGLIGPEFTIKQFSASTIVESGKIRLTDPNSLDRVAQIIARFLREELLASGEKFSFETVFSHPSNINIMQRARLAGYKVYLYFVGTETPTINKERVKARVKKGGHNVPEDRIESRYYRSLELMHDAARECYQAFFFDNSKEKTNASLIASFKLNHGKKIWDINKKTNLPTWFTEYYLAKELEA